ncbi:hypothetical protein Calla_1605 [Caldicellulosiruptor acetigenus 6A]|uniref:Uncharacterized protein n=1 Tax=Caldicellulosiruptor acetigenus 6A TaxID=632516 RepID=G2PT49_9FIRM|nr:hypothetical protein Calla_1605 [Caldicellulosiruptor acetigenus 6A]
MVNITSKELMFLEDNIKMMQNSINFIAGVSDQITDVSLKKSVPAVCKPLQK